MIRIGTVASHISLPENDAIDPAKIPVNAEVFGLHIFASAGRSSTAV